MFNVQLLFEALPELAVITISMTTRGRSERELGVIVCVIVCCGIDFAIFRTNLLKVLLVLHGRMMSFECSRVL